MVPFCNYTFLPVTVNMLETFPEAILWNTFQLFRRFLDDVSSIKKHRPLTVDSIRRNR